MKEQLERYAAVINRRLGEVMAHTMRKMQALSSSAPKL